MKIKFLFLFIIGIYFVSLRSGLMAIENSDYFKAKRYEFPIKKIAIISTKDGFYPQRIVLKEGEKLKIFLTSIKQNGCFFMAKKNIFISAKENTITEKDIFFEKAGNYEFNCPSTHSKGQIIVLSKKKKDKSITRKIASEPKVKTWIPRDY